MIINFLGIDRLIPIEMTRFNLSKNLGKPQINYSTKSTSYNKIFYIILHIKIVL